MLFIVSIGQLWVVCLRVSSWRSRLPTALRRAVPSRVARLVATNRMSPIQGGEMEHVKIVEPMVGSFDIGSRTLRVCADTEVIVRFVDSQYDHLRYVDDEQGCIVLVWLHQLALTVLADFGIPETQPRKVISQAEYDNWLEFRTMHMEDFEFDPEAGE